MFVLNSRGAKHVTFIMPEMQETGAMLAANPFKCIILADSFSRRNHHIHHNLHNHHSHHNRQHDHSQPESQIDDQQILHNLTHRIHGTEIFTYVWLIFMVLVNVGRYVRHVGILEILRKSNGWLNQPSEKYAQVELKHFPK